MLATVKWFASEFEGMERLKQTPLILPTAEFFKSNGASGHQLAEGLFEQVKAHADMSDWPCKLVEGERSRDAMVAEGLTLQHSGGPALGTFGLEGESITITYDPAQLDQPEFLIATFAHELAHYLLHSSKMHPPGGHDMEEHATDLAAVLMGFGVFLTNSARSFEQFHTVGGSGWQSQLRGYLSENALITAHALFVTLTDAPINDAEQYLKSYLRKPFSRAMRFFGGLDRPVADLIQAADSSLWVSQKRST